MTEKKPLREQRASYSYGQQERQERQQNKREPLQPPSVSDAEAVRPGNSSNSGYRHEPANNDAVQTRKRNVVITPQADPSAAWNTFSQRQEERRRARAQPKKYTRLVPRTFAQTGMHASSGRIPAVKRLSQSNSTPIPTRSGRAVAKRNWFWRLLALLFGGTAVILAATFVFTSNAFRIEQVNVSGTHNQALIDAIQRMGMQKQNIFLVNVTAITAQVESYPLVASASLSKQWPNQLLINVVERQPVLLWQTTQGTYSVDSQGVVIAPASDTVGADHLMTVVDTRTQSKNQSLHPGMHLNASDIAFATNVFQRLPQLIGANTFKLRYDNGLKGAQGTNAITYTIESSSGWVAYLGTADDSNPLDNRLTELQTILSLAQQQQLSLATIDLRYGLHPVYTLKP